MEDSEGFVYLYPVDVDGDVEVELLVLSDEDIEEEIKRFLSRSGGRPLTLSQIVAGVVRELRSRGYSVSEDRVRRVLREAVLSEKIPVSLVSL